MSDIAIKVENVSKKYCKSLKGSMMYGIADIGRNLLGLRSHSERLRANEFWAVDDVSFEVKRGETLGLIGPNGSGKTTLLKMLNGIFWPDKGKITIRGRVGALIAVGAGFHPMLTGRENIYINGAILGMGKNEIDKKFDAIVDFADIGDFLDSPVKHYSSGMFVRLGFAVAVHCEPEILLVDEVLAVGDINFQKKCLGKMLEFQNSNKAIMFISHNMLQIENLCTKSIFIDKGKVIKSGDTKDVIASYVDHANRQQSLSYGTDQIMMGTGEVIIKDIELTNDRGDITNSFESGENIIVVIKYRAKKRIYKPNIVVCLNLFGSLRVLALNTKVQNVSPEFIEGHGEAKCVIKNLPLLPNTYGLDIFIKDDGDGIFYDCRRNATGIVINVPRQPRIPYRVSGDMGIISADAEWKYSRT